MGYDSDKVVDELHSPAETRNTASPNGPSQKPRSTWKSQLQTARNYISIFVLLLNYFLAQYDKFILSYFQTPLSRTINLGASEYGILSGYATGIVYALAALPIAYFTDTFRRARVWVLVAASIWWSLCVVFQSLSNNFWQILLARIGMGLGQSCVEPLSISLISDLSGRWRNVFVGSSVFYVGVYIGEAISGQIATAFTENEAGWRVALRAIGITGIVLAVVLAVIVRDPGTRNHGVVVDDHIYDCNGAAPRGHLRRAREQLYITFSYLIRMRSFWLLLLSAGVRQLAGNVFGYYMPSYLQNSYPDRGQLMSHYGIIVGVVGTVSVLSGGAITSLLWSRTATTPLWLTALGGMVSSVFVLLMIFSRDIASGNQNEGVKVLYGSMSVAYLSAELWLGAINGLIASLLPPKYKTFGLAIYSSVQVLIYSSGPEIVGLALRGLEPGSEVYTQDTQLILACIIPVCYWVAAAGYMFAIPLLKRDVMEGVPLQREITRRRRGSVFLFFGGLASLVVALFIASIYYAAT